MDRRDFLKSALLSGGAILLNDWKEAFARGTRDPQVGKVWQGWKEGEFQIHFIYTGVGESLFLIFPDGTTMLLDCGDFDAAARGDKAVPILPNPSRHAGEWIARYVTRVNPAITDVDYMLLSHYHSDHGGSDDFYTEKHIRDGEEYPLSGFSLAAEMLRFSKAIDRSYPDTDDAHKYAGDDCVNQMRRFYRYMEKHRGLVIEKCRLGASDQIVQLKHPDKYPEFSVRNICGNGCIADENSHITDLYAARHALGKTTKNENAMSLGQIFTYGPFKFFTAGDFSHRFTDPDGTPRFIEDDLASVCPAVQVAKVNHHGHHSMSPKLASALRPRVWVSCVWDQLHNLPDSMSIIADRANYPGERLICPTMMPAERRAKDGNADWMKDVAKESYDGGHVVVNVEKGGERYSVTYLTAQDESMTVKSVLHFNSKKL